MSNPYPDTLALSSRVLRVLTKLNLLMGALIMALLIASLIAEAPVMRALVLLGQKRGTASPSSYLRILRRYDSTA